MQNFSMLVRTHCKVVRRSTTALLVLTMTNGSSDLRGAPRYDVANCLPEVACIISLLWRMEKKSSLSQSRATIFRIGLDTTCVAVHQSTSCPTQLQYTDVI